MARYIDADALYEKLYTLDLVDKRHYTINAKAVADAIAKIPTADVIPKSKYYLAVAEREANVKGFAEELAKTKAEVAREFAKYLIDHSQDGAVMISDLPDLVVDFTKGEDNG